MIQITSPELDKLAQKHYLFVSADVLGALNFYLDIFNAIGNKSTLDNKTDLTARYGFGVISLYAIINHLLDSKYQKVNGKKNIDESDIQDILFNGTTSKLKTIINETNSKQLYTFFQKVKTETKDVITGSPSTINTYIANNTFSNQTEAIRKECLEKIFSYEDFIKTGFTLGTETWNSYSLTRALDLSVCPYCNRNWIMTITEENEADMNNPKKIVNPQLDHYFCKKEYPVFRLSFYNLIPSCDTCNVRLKRGTIFKYDENLHPYEKGYDDLAIFKTIAKDTDSSIGIGSSFSVNIELDPLKVDLLSTGIKKKILKNHELFRIKEIYEQHGDIIGELYRIKHLYSDQYLENLKTAFKDFHLSPDEIYRIAFGNYSSDSNFKKRSFAKLVKDVSNQLGFIK